MKKVCVLAGFGVRSSSLKSRLEVWSPESELLSLNFETGVRSWEYGVRTRSPDLVSANGVESGLPSEGVS